MSRVRHGSVSRPEEEAGSYKSFYCRTCGVGFYTHREAMNHNRSNPTHGPPISWMALRKGELTEIRSRMRENSIRRE